LGADHVVNYKDTPDWHKTAWKITNGRGVDIIVEVGGAGTLGKSIQAVRAGGMVALIGVLSGAIGEINFGPVVTQNIRLQGVTVGARDLFEDMVRAIEFHGIEPPVDENLYAFDGEDEAIKSIPKGRHFGKVCSSFEENLITLTPDAFKGYFPTLIPIKTVKCVKFFSTMKIFSYKVVFFGSYYFNRF
jgi:NADPH:quinone reductase-like Zn-dependent oxidoreductase